MSQTSSDSAFKEFERLGFVAYTSDMVRTERSVPPQQQDCWVDARTPFERLTDRVEALEKRAALSDKPEIRDFLAAISPLDQVDSVELLTGDGVYLTRAEWDKLILLVG